MPKDIIFLSLSDLPDGLKLGSKMSVNLSGNIIDVKDNKAVIEVGRVSASQKSKTGAFDEMSAILKKINRNVSQLPKSSHLGNT